MSGTACRSKEALLCGLRPNPASLQKTQYCVCPFRCIYCDIWKLATLVSSHAPFSISTSPTKLQHRPSSSSTSSDNSFDWDRSQKAIEAQFQTQRARLASIMSICTVEGAEESEGLRVAHDRCLSSVTELMLREQMLEQRRTFKSRSSRSQQQPGMGRRWSNGCGESRVYYQDERRPTIFGMAR